jgi:hypothetical protein
MTRTIRKSVVLTAIVLAVTTMTRAADVNKALSDTEGRRHAAENGLKEIKSKAPQQVDQVRARYIEAASRQNAWLDSVCQAIEQGSQAAPDVSASATSAASALVEWVVVRKRALGGPELAVAAAENVKKSVAQDLVDIAAAGWKNNQSTDAKKRTGAAGALKQRLRWHTFDEI